MYDFTFLVIVLWPVIAEAPEMRMSTDEDHILYNIIIITFLVFSVTTITCSCGL